jgi:hypothetical protein
MMGSLQQNIFNPGRAKAMTKQFQGKQLPVKELRDPESHLALSRRRRT